MANVIAKRPVLWAMSDTVVTSALSIATMLVIAKLAGPSEFLTAALIMGTVMFGNIFVEVLFHDALIQHQAVTDEEFEQSVTVVLLVAIILIAATEIVAIVLSDGPYGRTSSLSVVASFYLLFSGPAGVANARQRRQLEFRHVARASVIGRAIGCAAGVTAAYAGFGTLGLLLQNVVGAFAQSVIIFATTGWRPNLHLTLDYKLVELLRYALPNALINSLVAARIQLFGFLTAWMFGPAPAGILNIAARLTTTPQMILITALTNLCFPIIAKAKSSKSSLDRAFLTTSKIVSTTTFPLFVGLALVAQDVVPLVLGAAWTDAVAPIRILALSCAIYFSRMGSSLLLRGTGTIKFSVWNATFQLLFTLAALVVLRPQTIVEAAYFCAAPFLIQIPISWLVVYRVTGISVFKQVSGTLPALFSVLLMAVSVELTRAEVQFYPSNVRLAASVLVGTSTFALAILALDPEIRGLVVRNREVLTEPWAPSDT
jgi:teichuronic acid exporter